MIEAPEEIEEFTVQQASELTGMSEHNLRYYEKVGLIRPIRRDGSSGHRRYSLVDIARIESLVCLRAVGMPLDQMRLYFERAAQNAPGAEQRQLLETHRCVLQERIQQMERHLQHLEIKIGYWQAVERGDDEARARCRSEFSRRIRANARGISDPDEEEAGVGI